MTRPRLSRRAFMTAALAVRPADSAMTSRMRDEEDHGNRHGRAVADAILGEEALEEREAHHLGRGAGSAAGQQIDLVEDLEGDDQTKGEGDQDRREHQRHGDEAELLPRRGAVDARRLEDVLRQRFEAGEEEQEAERRPVPDVDDDDRQQRRVGIAQPVARRDADQPEHLVHQPEVEVEHQLPDRADDDARDQDGQDEDGAEEDARRGRRG